MAPRDDRVTPPRINTGRTLGLLFLLGALLVLVRYTGIKHALADVGVTPVWSAVMAITLCVILATFGIRLWRGRR